MKNNKKVGSSLQVPVTTDIHSATEANLAAGMWIYPNSGIFMVGQTDILVAAAQTGKVVNIKKVNFKRYCHATMQS